METTKRYVPALRFHWLTPFYDAIVRFTSRERAFKDRLLRQADLRPGDDVLDLACGTGTLTLWAKKIQPDARVVGLDGDPAVLEIARRKTLERGAEVEFHEGLSYQLPFADDSFDCVLTSLFFHHLEPDQKVATLGELRRVLRPGGAVHIADWGQATGPVSRALFYTIQLLDGFSNTSDHVEGRLPRYLSESGFEEVRVRESLLTAYGVLSLFSCRRPVTPSAGSAGRRHDGE